MTNTIILTLVLLVAVCGGLAAITPWLMRKGECFTVTVPETAQRDPRIVVLKKRYTVRVLVVTLACTLLALAATTTLQSGSEGLFTAVYLAATFVPLVVSFALMLGARKQVAQIKRTEGWTAPASQQVSIAAVGENEPEPPRAISLWWNLLYVPLLAACAIVPLVFYDNLPNIIPMQINLDGEVTRTVQKSVGVALIPALINLFIVVCFVFSHASIAFSKKYLDPGAPATSAYAYGLFARAESIMMLVGGLILVACLGGTMVAAFLQVISMGVAATIVVAAALIMTFGAILVSVIYGQNGSRVFARMADNDQLLFDDDTHWKLGIFYFNREDPAVFLPKRFGVGWTCNLARPLAWALILGFIALTVAFVVAICTLA